MINIFSNRWRYDLWEPPYWSNGNQSYVYNYTIYIEDKNGLWNSTKDNITVQDTTPPPKPNPNIVPIGEVKGILSFDWDLVDDPSGIKKFRFIISTSNDPNKTEDYKIHVNVTSSYYELKKEITSRKYYFFISQFDGVGHESEYSIGTFTVVEDTESDGDGEDYLITSIIISVIILSAIGSATIITLKIRSSKRYIKPLKLIPLKIILIVMSLLY